MLIALRTDAAAVDGDHPQSFPAMTSSLQVFARQALDTVPIKMPDSPELRVMRVN